MVIVLTPYVVLTKYHYLFFENWMVLHVKMNSLCQRILCARFDLKWHSGSWEDFLNILNAYLLFHYLIYNLSPWKRGMHGPSNEQIWIPSPKDGLCQVWENENVKRWMHKQLAIRIFFKGMGVERTFVKKLCLFPLKMCSNTKINEIYRYNQPFS